MRVKGNKSCHCPIQAIDICFVDICFVISLSIDQNDSKLVITVVLNPAVEAY